MPDFTAERTNQKKFALQEYGYVPDGNALPLEYLVRVTSIRNQATVVCPLQEDLMLSVDSSWVPLVPVSLLSNVNTLVQAGTFGRKSVVTRATSRRIWTGTSPMSISLRMRFEAVQDTFKEVLEPCRILMSMALPSGPKETQGTSSSKFDSVQDLAGALDIVPFLSPPGPTPFSLEGILNLKGSRLEKIGSYLEEAKGGDLIMIEVGRYVSFFNVIIRSVSCITPVKFDNLGNPISASLNMVFETYEMMTVEALAEVFNKTTLSQYETGLNNEPNEFLP